MQSIMLQIQNQNFFLGLYLPDHVEMISIDKWDEGRQIQLRIQNMHEAKKSKHLPDVRSIIQGRKKFKNCFEANLVGIGFDNARSNNTCVNIVLQPLEIKSFILSW